MKSLEQLFIIFLVVVFTSFHSFANTGLYKGIITVANSGESSGQGLTSSVAPTTGLLDAFNRAVIGSNWSSILGTLVISENTVLKTGTPNTTGTIYWNVSTYLDSEVYATIVTKPTYGGNINLYARIDGSNNGYSIEVDAYAGTIGIYRIDAGTQVMIDDYYGPALISQAISDGDSVCLSVTGNTITALYKSVGGSWVVLGSRYDITYTNPGYLAVSITDTGGTTVIDNFGGGEIIKPQLQGVSIYALNGPATNLTFPKNNAINSTLIVTASGELSAASEPTGDVTITDSVGNTYTKLVSDWVFYRNDGDHSHYQYVGLFYCLNSQGTGSESISVTSSNWLANTVSSFMTIDEFKPISGYYALDGSNYGVHNGTTVTGDNLTGTELAPSKVNDLVFVYAVDSTGEGRDTWAPGSNSFNMTNLVWYGMVIAAVENGIRPTTDPFTPTIRFDTTNTVGNQYWTVLNAAFKVMP
jgi:hypothetical protein